VATRQDKLTIKSGSGSFVSNVQELRRRARTHIEQGAVIRFLGNDDPTTRRMLEGILADEEDHANDLRTLIESMGKDELEKAEHRR